MAYGRSRRRLVRDTELRRDRLERSIDALTDKLSLDNLVDEATDLFHGIGSRAPSMRNRSLPVALMGAGAAWLLADQARRRRSDDHYDYDDEDDSGDLYGYDRYGRPAPVRGRHGARYARRYSAAERYRRNEEDLYGDERGRRSRSGDGYGYEHDDEDEEGRSLRERAAETAGGLYQKAGESAGDLYSGAGEQLHGASRRVGRLRRGARRRARNLAETIDDRYQDNPLVAGLVLAATGVAIGMLLPPTRREDEFVGRHGDRLRERASDTARKAYDAASEHVSEATSEDEDGRSERPAAARNRQGATESASGATSSPVRPSP